MFAPGLIVAIDHVGIAVADLDEAIAFYGENFGLPLVHEEVNDDEGVREAMLAVGDSGHCLQLLAPLHAGSPLASFLDRRGPGLQQLAYRVTSITDAMAAVRAQGMRLVYDEPRDGTSGSRINFVHPKDAGGVLVELVEPASQDGGPVADLGGTSR
ncbi:MAG: methylmalonyl-CoA epimerase [Actinomycetota bacterium]|nr:methylmalonyl-CoA epimerase [Actinomycetota bacterium]